MDIKWNLRYFTIDIIICKLIKILITLNIGNVILVLKA